MLKRRKKGEKARQNLRCGVMLIYGGRSGSARRVTALLVEEQEREFVK